MARGSFKHYVEKLDEYIRQNRPVVLRLEDIVEILDVSPNYAREIAKALAKLRGYVYRRGKLIVAVEAEADE